VAYSRTAALRLPSSVYRVETYRDSPAPSSDPSDTTPMRWLPDMSSELRPVARPSSFRMDMSDMARPLPRPLSWTMDMSSAMTPVARPQTAPLATRQEGTVPMAAPRSHGVVQVLRGLAGGGGHHGGGHHGGGHHGGGHHGGGHHGGGHHGGGRGWGARGAFGPWGGYSYPYLYDYYQPAPAVLDTTDLELAVDEVGRMLAREPELVAVMDLHSPQRVLVTVLSGVAANRVRSMTPGSVRGIPVVVSVERALGRKGTNGLGGVFAEHMFSGLDTGIEGLGATLRINNVGQGDPAVRALQTQLARIGALAGAIGGPSPVDGKWGPNTANATRTAAEMVGYTGPFAYDASGSTVTVPDELLAAIAAYRPPARVVDPQPAPPPGTPPGTQMLPAVNATASSSRKWLPWLLVGGGILAAGTVVMAMTRKPRTSVAANRRRARRRSRR